MAAATTTTSLLPQLQAVFADIPSGVNPFAAYADAFFKQSYPGVIPWSKPVFIIVAVVSALNLFSGIVTLVAKHRREGLSLWKMRDHRSGSRYITLNSINVFLVFNVITCLVWIIYPILHLTFYNLPGKAHMDLGWAALMWLSPYTGLLLTSIGILYGILVTPSPLAFASRVGPDGHLKPINPPLAFLPCWLLNGFIFAAPLSLIVAVSIPASRLLNATKALEYFGLTVYSMLNTDARAFATTGVAVADQEALLGAFENLDNLNNAAASLWTPVYGIWSFFTGMASVLAVVAFFAIRHVTKTRMMLAQNHLTETIDDSGMFELGSPRKVTYSDNKAIQAVRQARFEHYNLCFQFGGAAVLLLVCFAILMFDCIKGWDVHTDPNLLAAALLVIMISYFLQSTPTVLLILYRTLKGRDMAGNAVPQGLPRGVRSTFARDDSEFTLADSKKVLFPGSKAESGAVQVSGAAPFSFPVSPSGVHHIQIHQVVHVETDSVDDGEKDDVSIGGSTAPSHDATTQLPVLSKFDHTYSRDA